MTKPGYWERQFIRERDRRLTEVALEREKALAIKDKADETARELDRQDRAYKDEKANNLRSQIESERGLYATKDDVQKVEEKLEALIAPLTKGADQQAGSQITRGQAYAALVAAVMILGLIVTAANFAVR